MDESTELHLFLNDSRNVRTLPQFPSFPDNSITLHIYAENCTIKSPLSKDELQSHNLRHLYVANNSINELDIPFLEKLEEMQTHLTLANNPLICDCKRKAMYDKIIKLRHLIDDFDQLTCDDGQPFSNRELCFPWDLFVLYFLVAVLTILSCFLLFYVRYTLEVQVYIYSRGWLPVLFRPDPDQENYEYDVFLSYSDKDEDFVVSVIDYLENIVSPPFKLCHHHRDWMAGVPIDRQVSSVYIKLIFLYTLRSLSYRSSTQSRSLAKQLSSSLATS